MEVGTIVRVEGDEIFITKGDTAIFDLKVKDYTFVEGDLVILSVKKNKTDSTYVIKKETTNFIDNVAKIVLESFETKIDVGKYWYDVQCSLASGVIDTIIPPSRLRITEEITE